MSQKRICFTGGGSGGHAVPAQTIIKRLRSLGYEYIYYIGGKQGLEKDLCEKNSIPYKAIATGKLRRYFSWQNFIDVFKVGWGFVQALVWMMLNPKVQIVFSTGGFVAVPAVIAGRLLGKYVMLHEQTTQVGLANKICAKFAHKIFISFHSSKKFFPAAKTEYSGYPVRAEFFEHKIDLSVLQSSGFQIDQTKPLLLVLGGGNGSVLMNRWVHEHLDELLKSYQVVHQAGKDHVQSIPSREGYWPVGFMGEELIDLMRASSLILCRAGAGTVAEMMAMGRRCVFIPLKIAQRNEQYLNAKEALNRIPSKIVLEDDFMALKVSDLEDGLSEATPQHEPSSNRRTFDGTTIICDAIESHANKGLK